MVEPFGMSHRYMVNVSEPVCTSIKIVHIPTYIYIYNMHLAKRNVDIIPRPASMQEIFMQFQMLVQIFISLCVCAILIVLKNKKGIQNTISAFIHWNNWNWYDSFQSQTYHYNLFHWPHRAPCEMANDGHRFICNLHQKFLWMHLSINVYVLSHLM